MSSIESPVDGTRLRWDAASGAAPGAPPVVLLHGSALSSAVWRGLGYLTALREEFTVVRMDLRGHGRSGAPHERAAYARATQVADVLAVCDAAGIDRFHLVGYSLGSRIALAAGLEQPDRVRSLVLLGGTPAPQHGAVDDLFFPGTVTALRTGGTEEFCARQGLGPDQSDPVAAATRRAFLANDALALAALLEATEADPGIADADLAACELPALWMTGERDRPRFEQSQRAAALMRRGRFIPLPGRTHGGTLGPSGPVLAHMLPFLRAAR